jgi:hypothetical protein
MTTDIIGKKDKSKEDPKANYYQYGGLIIKKKRSTSLLFHGIQDTKTCLQFL